jgi:hypothetical protein
MEEDASRPPNRLKLSDFETVLSAMRGNVLRAALKGAKSGYSKIKKSTKKLKSYVEFNYFSENPINAASTLTPLGSA